MQQHEPLFARLSTLPGPVRELIAGGIAGATAKSCIAPLERCKILFQTGKLYGARLWPTISHIYQTEGVPGLFRGNGASVLRIMPYAAVQFTAYERYRRILVTAHVLGAQEHIHVSPAVDLLAGSAAGASAVIVTYPLDLVRTRLAFMTEAGGSRGSRAAGAAAATLASPANPAAAAGSSSSCPAAGGRMPLYHAGRGTAGLALASSGCSNGVFSSGGGSSMASSAGRVAATLAAPTSSGCGCGSRLQGHGPLRPLHLLAQQAQRAQQTPHLQHTIRSVISTTFRKEGVRGLYHGVGASMYGILPYAGLKFYCYQHLKQWYHHVHPGQVTRTGVDGKPRLPVPVMLSFGAVAGLVAQSITYPLDVVRRQMQVEGLKLQEAAAGSPTSQLSSGAPQLSLRSTPQALVLLARQHGWRCLYAGLSINYMKVVPSTAIGFTIYDYMKSAMALPSNL